MRLAFVPLLLTGLVAACASTADRRYAEIEAALAPRVGVATQQEILDAWGAPSRQQRIAGSEVWVYHLPHGSRGLALGSPRRVEGVPLPTVRASRRKPVNDVVTMRFDDEGVLVGWHARVE